MEKYEQIIIVFQSEKKETRKRNTREVGQLFRDGKPQEWIKTTTGIIEMKEYFGRRK